MTPTGSRPSAVLPPPPRGSRETQDGDTVGLGLREEGRPVDQEGAPGVHRQDPRAGLAHGGERAPAPRRARRSACPGVGFETLTTVVPGPAMRPARRIISSVPSMASSATAALSFTTAVWPRSIPARARATVSPYSTSFRLLPRGPAAGHGPARASWSARSSIGGSRVMPSRRSASATAPIRLSVFWKARRARARAASGPARCPRRSAGASPAPP